MYKNILVPTDGSPLSRAAAAKAVEFAKSVGAKITAFFAAPAPTPLVYKGMLPVGFITPSKQAKLTENLAAQHLERVEKLARAAGVPVKSVHVTDDYPASAILATAKKEICDHDLHGFAWPHRFPRLAARQPDAESACAVAHPGAGASVRSGAIPGAGFRRNYPRGKRSLTPAGRAYCAAAPALRGRCDLAAQNALASGWVICEIHAGCQSCSAIRGK